MNILVTGSTGLIGSALVSFLIRKEHRVVRLTRSKAGSDANELYWDPMGGLLDFKRLEGFDAVVHLAGENIGRRWTAAEVRRIRESRIQGTRLLITALRNLSSPPKVLISASAIGFYGDRGSEILDEESKPGNNFLSGLCLEWEATAKTAAEAGIRVTIPRIGVVLSRAGLTRALASNSSSAIRPSRMRSAKAGVGKIVGLARTRPRARVNSPFVTGKGATALMVPASPSSLIAR